MSVSIKHRYGNHGGRRTEWEIEVNRSEDSYCADMIVGLPKDFKNISHSGTDRKYEPASEWLILPEGTSARDAGFIAAILSYGDAAELAKALWAIDQSVAVPTSEIPVG